MEPTTIGLIVFVVILVLAGLGVGIFFAVKKKGDKGDKGSDSSSQPVAEDSSAGADTSASSSGSAAISAPSAAISAPTAAMIAPPASSAASSGGVSGYKEYPGLSWVRPNGNWAGEAYDSLSDYIPITAKYAGIPTREECTSKCNDLKDACMGVAYDPANQRCALLRVGITDGNGRPYPGAGDGWVMGIRKEDNSYKEFKPVGLNRPLAGLNPSYFKKLNDKMVRSAETCKSLCNTSTGACHGVLYKNVIDDVNLGERQFDCYHFNIPPAAGVNSTVSTLMKTA